MQFWVFRGTARKLSTESAETGTIHTWACLAYADSLKAGVEVAHGKLKAAGYLTLTLDGPAYAVPTDLAEQDPARAEDAREAREHGAVVVISREPGDPWPAEHQPSCA